MDVEERLQILTRGTEEVVTMDELRGLLESSDRITSYIGFEPSGLMHIGQGFIIARKVKDFCEAGLETTILLADWHAYINDKLGGNLGNIRICGSYVRDCFIALGVDPSKTKFIYANDLVGRREYWQKVLAISKNSTIARMRRAMTIMGRKEEDADVDASKLIYPAMQAADILELSVDVALGGMDQRHAHMLLRDVAPKMGVAKPVAVHTPLLAGLQGGERMDSFDFKMSKSRPESFISIHEETEDISTKVNKAFCPPATENNPIIDICEKIIFPAFGEMKVEREEKFGSDIEIDNMDDLLSIYSAKQLHASDLKRAVSYYLDELLQPVREYFRKKPGNLERMKAILNS